MTMMRQSEIKRLGSLIAVFFLVIVCVGAFFISEKQRELQLLQQKNAEEDAAECAQFMDEEILSFVEKSNTLKTVPWVLKLLPDNYFLNQTYFTGTRKYEIAKEFSAYRDVESCMESLILVYPYSDIFIMPNVFTSISTGFAMKGIRGADMDALVSEIKTLRKMDELPAYSEVGNGLAVCIPLENTVRPRAALIFTMDLANMQKKLGTMLKNAGNGLRFEIVRGDQTVFSAAGNTAGKEMAVSIASRYIPGWTYKAVFENNIARLGFCEYIYRILLESLIVFFVLCAAAWAVFRWALTPLMSISTKLTPYKQGELKLEGIVDELLKVHNLVLRKNALQMLLKGGLQREGAEETLKKNNIQISEKDFCRVILLIPDQSDDGQEKDSLAFDMLPGVRFETLETLNNESILLLLSDCQEALEEQGQMIAAAAKEAGRMYAMGDVSLGHTGVSLSYRRARLLQIYLHRGEKIRYYFPIALESRLISGIHSGDHESVKQTINELRKENEKRLENGDIAEEDLMKLFLALELCLQRVANEMGVENVLTEEILLDMRLVGSVAERFDAMLAACKQMCEVFAGMNPKEYDKRGEELLDYIRRNLSNPALSLQSAAQDNGMSPNTVNKLLKQICGETFYICLTRIRMEAAKALLLEGKLSVAEVAKRSGYDTDIAFRRAFKRYTGVTPRGIRAEINVGEQEEKE